MQLQQQQQQQQQFQPMGVPQQQTMPANQQQPFQPVQQAPQQMMQPMAPQQPLQYPPTMSPEQQQQFQKIVQNMPPEKLQALQQEAQQMVVPQQPAYTQTTTDGLFTSPAPITPMTPMTPGNFGQPKPTEAKDEKKGGKVQRFLGDTLGDTLVGRVARASVQTATSALEMSASLSPWGDNNPVTLPNVRYRDAVLFTTFAFVGAPLPEGTDSFVSGMFGADSFISEADATVGSTVLKNDVFQIVEQTLGKGIIEHMLPEEEKMLQTTNVKNLQVGIKHKLMGVDADLRFAGIYPAKNTQDCAKGWFCPYLFASARTPQVPRANDFAVAQFFGPFVSGMSLCLILPASHPLTSFSICTRPSLPENQC